MTCLKYAFHSRPKNTQLLKRPLFGDNNNYFWSSFFLGWKHIYKDWTTLLEPFKAGRRFVNLYDIINTPRRISAGKRVGAPGENKKKIESFYGFDWKKILWRPHWLIYLLSCTHNALENHNCHKSHSKLAPMLRDCLLVVRTIRGWGVGRKSLSVQCCDDIDINVRWGLHELRIAVYISS